MGATQALAESLSKLEAIASQAKSLDDFLSKPQLINAYHQALVQYQHRDKFRCESFEKIIKKLKVLCGVPGFKQSLWAKQDPKPVFITAFPSEEDAIANHNVHTVYVFRPVPRLFHGIWNDPSNGSCKSDDCEKNDLTSPERWAVALKGSQLYYLERDGIFTDQSLLVTPVEAKGKTYPLLSITGGPGLTRPLTVVSSLSKSTRVSTLLQEWAARAMKRNPKSWGTFVVVKHTDQGAEVRPWKTVIDTKQSSDKPIAALHNFSTIDRMAKAIESALPRNCQLAHTETASNLFLGLVSPTSKGTKTSNNSFQTAANLDSQASSADLVRINPQSASIDASTSGALQSGQLPPGGTKTETTQTQIIYGDKANPTGGGISDRLDAIEKRLAQKEPTPQAERTFANRLGPMEGSVNPSSRDLASEEKETSPNALPNSGNLNPLGNLGMSPNANQPNGDSGQNDPGNLGSATPTDPGNSGGLAPPAGAAANGSQPNDPHNKINFKDTARELSNLDDPALEQQKAQELAKQFRQAPNQIDAAVGIFGPNKDADPQKLKRFQSMVVSALETNPPPCMKGADKK